MSKEHTLVAYASHLCCSMKRQCIARLGYYSLPTLAIVVICFKVALFEISGCLNRTSIIRLLKVFIESEASVLLRMVPPKGSLYFRL